MATKKSSSKPSAENQQILTKFFLEELKDIYWAENHLVKSLPKFQQAATTQELADAFAEHLEVTKGQVSQLEKVFELMGEKPEGKMCEAMDGLVSEGQSVVEDTEEGSATRDVALIISAQKVEHYEIAAYGGLATLAKSLGLEEVGNILGEILEQEKQTDALLTQIAEGSINLSAVAEQQAMEGGEQE